MDDLAPLLRLADLVAEAEANEMPDQMIEEAPNEAARAAAERLKAAQLELLEAAREILIVCAKGFHGE